MKKNLKNTVRPEADDAIHKLGGFLKEARLARNMTVAELAIRAGTSASTVKRIEAGDPSVSMAYWASCFALLGLLPQWIASISPPLDKVGQGLRAIASRKRAGRRSKMKDLAEYDF